MAEGATWNEWRAPASPPSSGTPMPGYGHHCRDTLRRGQFKNYTFRLPQHLPEITISVVAEVGSVCLYASNCSERPQPRMCQWTLLADASKSNGQSSLKLRTNEHHFVSGLYHCGVYCISDAQFSLGCFATRPSASDVLHSTMQAKRDASRSHLADTSAAARREPTQRSTKRPFHDAGLLEVALSARATQPAGRLRRAAAERPVGHASDTHQSAASPKPAAWRSPGNVHYEHLLTEWHKGLHERTAAERAMATPQRRAQARPDSSLPSLPPLSMSNGLLPPPQKERISPRVAAFFQPAPSWLGGPLNPVG